MIEERQLTIADVDGAMPEGWDAGSLFTGDVHPVADLFPMMTDDEMEDLAADITLAGVRVINPFAGATLSTDAETLLAID